METFTLLSSTAKEAGSVRCVAFSRCGRALLSGASDCLRTWSWEPSEQLGVVPVEWGTSPSAGAGTALGGTQVLCDMVEASSGGEERGDDKN